MGLASRRAAAAFFACIFLSPPAPAQDGCPSEQEVAAAGVAAREKFNAAWPQIEANFRHQRPCIANPSTPGCAGAAEIWSSLSTADRMLAPYRKQIDRVQDWQDVGCFPAGDNPAAELEASIQRDTARSTTDALCHAVETSPGVHPNLRSLCTDQLR